MKADMLGAGPAALLGQRERLRAVVVKYLEHFIPNASGTSAVAIDNKIEQAMDLVKSHLMFAVREEVEVLKERIAELMERINQLELENTILKAHASQETLAQLGSSKGGAPAAQSAQGPQGQAAATQNPQQQQQQQTQPGQQTAPPPPQQQSAQVAPPTAANGGPAPNMV